MDGLPPLIMPVTSPAASTGALSTDVIREALSSQGYTLSL